jgi:hypothetical protein
MRRSPGSCAPNGRCSARTKPEHVEPLKTWRGNLQVLEDTVAALLANEKKYNAMYEGGSTYVQVEIRALKDHIATAKPLLADVEAEKDPEAALKAAIAAISKGGKEKVRLEEVYGKEDLRGARALVEGERTEREKKERKASEQAAYAAAREKEEADKQAAAAEAEKERQDEMTGLGFTPNAAGPAYARPDKRGDRLNLLRYIELAHPSFSTLGDEIHRYACFVYKLTLAQIKRVETFLEGRKVTEWQMTGIPASRNGTGLESPMVMPLKVGGLVPELGAEIFVDWVVHRPGHSSPVSRIAESFTFTSRADFVTGGWGTIEDNGNKAYRYANTGKRLVTNANRTAIITYYNGR